MTRTRAARVPGRGPGSGRASAAEVRPAAAPAESAVLKQLFRGTWDELPLLLVGSVVLCLGFYLAAAAVPGITPISLPVLAIAMAPGATVLVRVYLRIGSTDTGTDTDPDAEAARGTRTGGGGVVRAGGRVAAVVLVPAVAGSLYLVARYVAVDRGVSWAVPSMLLCGAVTIVAVLLAVAALPIAAGQGRAGASLLLQTAVTAVVRQPVPLIASLVLPAAAVLVVSELSATLLLFFPAPVALVIVAAHLTAAADLRRPAPVPRPEGPSTS